MNSFLRSYKYNWWELLLCHGFFITFLGAMIINNLHLTGSTIPLLYGRQLQLSSSLHWTIYLSFVHFRTMECITTYLDIQPLPCSIWIPKNYLKIKSKELYSIVQKRYKRKPEQANGDYLSNNDIAHLKALFANVANMYWQSPIFFIFSYKPFQSFTTNMYFPKAPMMKYCLILLTFGDYIGPKKTH